MIKLDFNWLNSVSDIWIIKPVKISSVVVCFGFEHLKVQFQILK